MKCLDRYVFLLLIAVLAFTGCRKKDTSPPSITLTGSSSARVPLNSSWSEPGYSAQDDKDGDLTESVEVSGSVNGNFAGTYVITYTVLDQSGNEFSVSRTIQVYNEAEYLAGIYSGTDTCSTAPAQTYTASITLSNSVNREFFIQNFGGWNPLCNCNTAVRFNVNGITQGSTLSWAGQPIANNDTLIAASAGVILSLSPAVVSLSYQWTNGTTTKFCTGVYTHQ